MDTIFLKKIAQKIQEPKTVIKIIIEKKKNKNKNKNKTKQNKQTNKTKLVRKETNERPRQEK